MTDPIAPRLQARLFVALQHLLPQLWLSERMYRLARIQWRPLKALLIRTFARLYRIDMGEALEPDLTAYAHFNAFFTRALKPDARPLDPDPQAILCPVDGAISQLGTITEGRLIQAKGRDYSVQDLLGLEEKELHPFDGGHFATIYLSPNDYHRIHMPLTGQLNQMTHVPGQLFSVNATTAERVPGLFARNERVICRFDTEAGPMAMILVGAIFVGGMETVWAGEITPPHSGKDLQRWDYPVDGPRILLTRGEEMGRFNLGSTVILLFPPGRAHWEPSLAAGDKVRLGQRLGSGSGSGSRPIPQADVDREPLACRPGCAACCIAPSISSPIPGMPQGKPAGVACTQLAPDLACRLFGSIERPRVCGALSPSREMCGTERGHALRYLVELEGLTSPARTAPPPPTTRSRPQAQPEDATPPAQDQGRDGMKAS